MELWTEYKFGISRRKAAQKFTFCQRNSSKVLKQKYWGRNQVWMVMAGLVNCCGVQGEEVQLPYFRILDIDDKDLSIVQYLRNDPLVR